MILAHNVAASLAHKNKHAGGPGCKVSPHGSCLATQGSTLGLIPWEYKASDSEY